MAVSAECAQCGSDLVFTTWPDMTCQLCDQQERIQELERQLESARSLAVDRDQRLARIALLVTTETRACPDTASRWALAEIRKIATGMDDA